MYSLVFEPTFSPPPVMLATADAQMRYATDWSNLQRDAWLLKTSNPNTPFPLPAERLDCPTVQALRDALGDPTSDTPEPF